MRRSDRPPSGVEATVVMIISAAFMVTMLALAMSRFVP
jgi:hypothetical protein